MIDSGSLELLFSGSRPTSQEEHIGSMLQVPTLMSITSSLVSLKDLLSPIGDILHWHGVNYHMYADDIQIYLDFNPTIPCDAECCLFKLSNCIQDVQTWILANKLMLTENKTEFFI